jgi:hypothetical protein
MTQAGHKTKKRVAALRAATRFLVFNFASGDRCRFTILDLLFFLWSLHKAVIMLLTEI